MTGFKRSLKPKLMFDQRPVIYVIGLLVMALGSAMLVPMLLDLSDGHDNWQAFALSAFMTVLLGGGAALSCQNADHHLNIQQTFILTTGVWLIMPIFAAIPFIIGAPSVDFTNAFFEAMSGMTTTGATVFTGLEDMPRGVLLWRGMLQWFGGIGVVVVAMVFLPVLRVGGMQIFRTEGFDTFGKILPRAAEISRSVSQIYLGLTLICFIAYSMAGLGAFDAIVHAMTTIATGGFSNYDRSFAELGAGAEYVGTSFMLLAALPFVRYIQLISGGGEALWRDPQVRGFFTVAIVVVLVLLLWRVVFVTSDTELAFRKALFNGVSILTGTGYASDNYMRWGSFAVTVFFFIGLIGGCAGSTTCSIKGFRFQLLFASVLTQIRRIQTPSGIFEPRYAGRRVAEDVISSVMAFFMMFMVSLAVISVLLSFSGLDLLTSMSGASAALANIGPGLGDVIGPAGNYESLNDFAKWVLALAMLVGRLELMAVFVLLTGAFWRG